MKKDEKPLPYSEKNKYKLFPNTMIVKYLIQGSLNKLPCLFKHSSNNETPLNDCL